MELQRITDVLDNRMADKKLQNNCIVVQNKLGSSMENISLVTGYFARSYLKRLQSLQSVLLILTLICFSSPKLCSAELRKEFNEYTGNEDLMSICINPRSYRSDTEDYGYIDEVKFYKADGPNYIILFKSTYDAGDTIQGPCKDWIVIDGQDFRLTGEGASDKGQGSELSGYYVISREIAEKIKRAKSVKMKYTGEYNIFVSLDIPEPILKEWQAVITEPTLQGRYEEWKKKEKISDGG
jgi:hypothetical protein